MIIRLRLHITLVIKYFFIGTGLRFAQLAPFEHLSMHLCHPGMAFGLFETLYRSFVQAFEEIEEDTWTK